MRDLREYMQLRKIMSMMMVVHGSWNLKCTWTCVYIYTFVWVCPFCFVSGFCFKKSKGAWHLERPWEEWCAYWHGTLWNWTCNHEGFVRACRKGKYNKKHDDGTTWLLEVQHASILGLQTQLHTCLCECPFCNVFILKRANWSLNLERLWEEWQTCRTWTLNLNFWPWGFVTPKDVGMS